MLEILKLLGLTTPFIYAAGTYGFFHYLDKQASLKAKKAISGWFKPLEYDRAAVAAATVEIFDRLYTRPLLGWRAALRSALFTVVITLTFAYEFIGIYEFVGINDIIGKQTIPYTVRLIGEQTIPYRILLDFVLTNVVADYISLFIVRKLLVVATNRPLIALVIGPMLGACVVGLFIVVRPLVMIWFYSDYVSIQFMIHNWLPLVTSDDVFLSLPALAVHLWLPLFGFGLLCVNGLNYLFWAIGGMQWFLKRGNDHPLDAVGYVLGAMVFVGTGILQFVR